MAWLNCYISNGNRAELGEKHILKQKIAHVAEDKVSPTSHISQVNHFFSSGQFYPILFMFTAKLPATVLCPTRPFTLQKGILMTVKPDEIPSFLHQGLEYLENGIQLAGMFFSVPCGQSVYKEMNRRKPLKTGTSEQCILRESRTFFPGVLQYLGFC